MQDMVMAVNGVTLPGKPVETEEAKRPLTIES